MRFGGYGFHKKAGKNRQISFFAIIQKIDLHSLKKLEGVIITKRSI